jgi:hypothetical protein
MRLNCRLKNIKQFALTTLSIAAKTTLTAGFLAHS